MQSGKLFLVRIKSGKLLFKGGQLLSRQVQLPEKGKFTYGKLAQHYSSSGKQTDLSCLRYHVIIKPIISGAMSRQEVSQKFGIHPITIRKCLRLFIDGGSTRKNLKSVGVGGRNSTLTPQEVDKIRIVRRKRGSLSFEVAQRLPELKILMQNVSRSVYYRAIAGEGAYC